VQGHENKQQGESLASAARLQAAPPDFGDPCRIGGARPSSNGSGDQIPRERPGENGDGQRPTDVRLGSTDESLVTV
jgi:hypothetical protein